MTEACRPLAITLGDPSGIGPEIIVKALLRKRAEPIIVVGSAAVLQEMIEALGLSLAVYEIAEPHEATEAKGQINVLDLGFPIESFPKGTVSEASGKLAFEAILKAIELAKQGQISGIVTAPIHKEAFAAGGIRYPGHTEILAAHGGADQVAMMLANDEIRTVLVTIHCSLRDAIERATFEAQLSAIRLAHRGCRALGIETPRIAVAGLNPHAGEGGLFGREEIEVIEPAIHAACQEGMVVSGPWAGDTVFMNARRGKFDVVVAQYHDQGLIPVKYMGVEKGVNITLGLPFVRTSPDHGTAFDIAGQGIADESSLCTAIDYAWQLVKSARAGGNPE